MDTFKKLSRQEKLLSFIKHNRSSEFFYEDGVLYMDDKTIKMVLILEGCRSKRKRVIKKVLKRFWTKALTEGMELL